MDIETFATAFAFLKNAIGLAKDANDLVADSPKRRAAELALAQAEQQLRLAESRAAVDLGYHKGQSSPPLSKNFTLEKPASFICFTFSGVG